MGKLRKSKQVRSADPIAAYSRAQSAGDEAMCEALRKLIVAGLPGASAKVWHGSPVWFIDENPVVGYNSAAKGVNLLFWNGRAVDAGLAPVGKYYAAQAVFGDVSEIKPAVVRRWLKKARLNVFDSKGFFKKMREGKRKMKDEG